MKFLLALITICYSLTATAGVGSFAVGYMVGKSGNKRGGYSNKNSPTEIQELRDKVVGGPMRTGWAFDFTAENMVVKIDLSGYNKELVLKLLNDLTNDGYPVSLSKKQEMIFDWKQDYCSNHDKEKDLKYASLLKRVSDISIRQAYSYLKCPFLEELSSTQKEELLGEDFETGSYLIGGGSWVGYQFEYERHSNTYKRIENKTQQIRKVAEKYCNMEFKDTTSRILSHIFTMKESYLVKSKSNVEIKDLKFSHKKICGS